MCNLNEMNSESNNNNYEDYCLFIGACVTDNLELVQKCVNEKYVGIAINNGQSLINASYNNNIEVINFLVNEHNKYMKNVFNYEGEIKEYYFKTDEVKKSLQIAIEHNDLDIFKILLCCNDVDIDFKLLLKIAVKYDSTNILNYIMNNGTFIEEINDFNIILLDYAIEYNRYDLIKQHIMECDGLDLSDQLKKLVRKSQESFNFIGLFNIGLTLSSNTINSGILIYICNVCNVSLVKYILDLWLNNIDLTNNHPLIIAINKGDLELAKLLIEYGFKLSADHRNLINIYLNDKKVLSNQIDVCKYLSKLLP